MKKIIGELKMKKIIIEKRDAENGLFWVKTMLNGRYLGGAFKDLEEVEDMIKCPECNTVDKR